MLAATSLLLSIPGRSPAADFTIDAIADAGDANPGDGYCDSILVGFDCTLRAAVQEANALAGPDTIFIPNLFLVVNIVGNEDAALAGDFDITDDLEITGSLFTTIMVTHGEQAFDLRSGTLRLDNLTVDNGGITTLSGTALEVIDVDLDASIVNRGRGHLVRTTIDGSPQTGVTNEGTLTISESAIHNSGSIHTDTGGIDNSGALLVERTSIAGNATKQLGVGGGLYNRSGGEVLVSNSQVVFNGDGFGLTGEIRNEGWMRWSHVLVQGSPIPSIAIVVNMGVLEMQSSRLEGPLVCGGTPITSRGYNTISDGTCLSVLGPGDAENSTAFQDRVPARLCPLIDQEGRTRRAGETCDSGPTELGHDAIGCANGLDDDGDGFVDLQDPGCRDADDPLEAHIRPGDAVLANFDTGGVTVFDPETTRLFPLTRASGGISPWDIHVDTDGEIHFSDSTFASLTSVDVEEGSAFLVSAGDQLQQPTGIDQNWLGEWFVGDRLSDAIFEIDPQTGVQSLITSHPDLGDIDDILRRPGTGSLYVSDTGSGIRVVTDPLGSPSVYTIATTTITVPRQLDFDSAFDLVIADSGDNIPAWKDLQSIAETPLLTAPGFTNMQGAAVEPSGLSLFTDYDTGEIKRVDQGADTATLLNFGREETGINHLALVPSAADLTLTLEDALVIDGGTAGVVDVGDTLELKAVVTNVGATTATLLSLESGLDPNLTLVAGQLTTTQGTLVEGSFASDPRLEVDLGNLAPAASATVTWRVDVADPAPARSVTANAWVRREKIILAESDDPSTGPVGDANVMKVGAVDIVIQAFQKLSDTRGELSGAGNPGAALSDDDYLTAAEPVGDLDGDGVDDLALVTRNSGLNDVHLALMRSDGTVKSRIDVAHPPGVVADDGYGRCPTYLGDLDGAGSADFALAIGAISDDGNGMDRGAVHILFLQNDGTLVSSTKIADGGLGGLANGSLADNDYFGTCVESLRDLDGPGGSAHAIAVGASGEDDGGNAAGTVFVLFLNTNGTVSGTPVKITQGSGGFDGIIQVAGETKEDSFGVSIEWLGDLDGDGNPELAVGEGRDDRGDPSNIDAGALWIFSVGSNGNALAGAVKHDGGVDARLLPYSFAGSRFARLESVRVDDLDDDGVPELLVGTLGATGYALLYLDTDKSIKKVEAWSDALAIVPELQGAAFFGAQQIGDLDGDGRPEIAMGPGDALDDDGGANRGVVYVLYPEAIPVPEPSGLLGLGSGFLMLHFLDRRRRRR